jgi:hypothetical protein
MARVGPMAVALSNNNWKQAMDIEYDALEKMRHVTWFLHRRVETSLIANGSIRSNRRLMAI